MVWRTECQRCKDGVGVNKTKRVAQLKHRRKRKKLEAKREAEREAQ